MLTVNSIRLRICEMFNTNPNIHVNINLSHSRIRLENDPVVIKGVYPYVFRIEERSTGVPKCHTLQYTDILTGNIEIIEFKK